MCIGCKACEVACKEWNGIPEDGLNLLGQSYDNTGGLTANSWRPVHFVEQTSERIEQARESGRRLVSLGMPSVRSGDEPGLAAGGGAATATRTPPGDLRPGAAAGPGPTDAAVPDMRWLMMSNVCKHCTHAACLDVCPTGALFRTEFGTVVIQEDICNGCGYCMAACPYGVIERQRKDDGRASRTVARLSIKGAGGDGSHEPAVVRVVERRGKNPRQKCTLCYDRIGDGLTPACAKACPTQSIQYGDLDELRERAQQRVERLHEVGVGEARLYGHDARRRRRRRGVLPAARRAGGVRAAAGPGGHHPRPAGDVEAGRPRRGGDARRGRGRVPRRCG